MLVKDLFEEELFEMANLDAFDHGIDDVVIWVGMAPGQHGLRIKISNLKNQFSPDKRTHFTLTIPEFQIRDGKPEKWLASKMEDIIDWVKLNIDTIKDYENGKIHITRDFLNKLKKLD